MAYSMGESERACLQVNFDRRLIWGFRCSKVTTDAGWLAEKGLDDIG